MKKRIGKKKNINLADLSTFFLACEIKTKPEFWSVIEPFAYDIKPAFIHGSLGIMCYEPEAYSIIDIQNDNPPLLGYVMTITHPDTIKLLDKIKGFNGDGAFNYHHRKLVHAYTDLNEATSAWCYVLSDHVLDSYRQMEQVEFGLTEDDEELITLLEKIEESI